MKKVLTLVLAVIMVSSIVIVAGCSSQSAPASTAEQSTAAATQSAAAATQSAAAPASSAEAAQSAAAPASGSKTKGFRIAYTRNFMGNSWTTQYEQAVRARLDRYKQLGIVSDYTYVAVNSDVTAQLNQLNTLLQDNYDVIMVDPVSPTSLTSFITEAKQKGVKVILGCTNAPVEGIPSFSSDYSVYGLSEAQYLMDQIGGKGNIAEIHGVPGDPNSALFQKYAKQIYDKYPDVKIIATGYGKWNDADAQTAMSTLIASYGDQINGIFAEDGMAYGIVNAYQNAGKPLVPMGGDYFNTFIQYWYHNEDKIHTTVTVNSPFALGTALADICVYEAAGYAPKQLEPNPLDESVSNWVPLEFPYVIFNKDEMTPSWMSQFPHTKAISIDDVAKQMADQPNTAAPELYFDDNYIASLFGVDKNPWLS